MTHFVMFVKNALEKVVSIVIELRGAIWRDLYSATIKQRLINVELKTPPTPPHHHPGHQEALMVLHREQVLLRELQVIVVAKPPQDGPGGLVSATLDEESVQEQEPCMGQ